MLCQAFRQLAAVKPFGMTVCPELHQTVNALIEYCVLRVTSVFIQYAVCAACTNVEVWSIRVCLLRNIHLQHCLPSIQESESVTVY